MRFYVKPDMEIEVFDVEDIITQSPYNPENQDPEVTESQGNSSGVSFGDVE